VQETQLPSQQAINFALFESPIAEILASASLPMMQCPLLMQHNLACAEETGALIGKTNPRSTKIKINFLKNLGLKIIL